MLVLSRKIGEKLIIDGNITLEFVRVQGNRITLGINAPSDIKVLRGELKPSNTADQTFNIEVEDGVLVPC